MFYHFYSFSAASSSHVNLYIPFSQYDDSTAYIRKVSSQIHLRLLQGKGGIACFSWQRSTTAVSALRSIITSAQFVEDIVDRSDSMSRIQVCVFVKSTTPDRGTTQRVLWSSVEDTRASLHRNAMNSLEKRAPSSVNNNEAIIGNEKADDQRWKPFARGQSNRYTTAFRTRTSCTWQP